MFSLMGNCCNWLTRWREPARKVTLVMVGLDNAGKTSTVQGLQGENTQDVAPTVGFTKIEMIQDKFRVTIFDLGGGKRIRDIWKNYYAESHGVVFTVDSSDVERIQETKETLKEVLSHPRISGKPVLVLANKQDKREALYESEIIERLCLEPLVNKYKCRCKIVPCAAILGYGKMADKSIKKGLMWLLDTIALEYEIITDRVQKDTAEQRAQEEHYKKERAERVRLIREEREREELEKAELEGREIQEEEPNDENMQNPFQPISSVISVYENKELEMQRQTALQEATSIKTDAVQEEEDNGKDDEPDNKKQTPDNSSSDTAGKQDRKKERNFFLKRKHRVEPLQLGDGPAAVSETCTSPPLPEFYKKPLPPLVNRPKPNGDDHDVIS